VCALAALCYAELAAMVPVAGSAYTFTYATLGELAAFVIGWDLALGFIVGASAVAVGWSAYLNSTLDQIFGVTLPATAVPDAARPVAADRVGPALDLADGHAQRRHLLRFVVWMIIGFFVYGIYSRRRSRLA
jgi:amino acid transporter